MTDRGTQFQAVLDHYRRHWGEPSAMFDANAELLPANHPPISVAEFEPAGKDQDWAYATVGMSLSPVPIPDANGPQEDPINRAELFIYSSKRDPSLPTLLAKLARYPLLHNTWLGPGHTVQGEGPVTPGSAIMDILFLSPLGEPATFEFFHPVPSTHARMLWVIPIYRSELEIAKGGNWKELVNLFFDQETNTSDMEREPVV